MAFSPCNRYLFVSLFLCIHFAFSHYWQNKEADRWTEESKSSLLGLRSEARKINLLERETGWFNRLAAENLFKRYVLHFNRPYLSDVAEYKKRLEIFIKSLKRQEELNNEEEKYKLGAVFGVNKFSDWTRAEFKGLLRARPLQKDFGKKLEMSTGRSFQSFTAKQNGDCSYKVIPPPKAVDWRKARKVTPVKNQGNCGSCWAFVATEQTESYWAIAGKGLQELSVQEFISCAPSLGCNGGNTCQALLWLAVKEYNQTKCRLVKNSEYPYEAKETPCKYGKTSKTGATISGVCGCESLVGHEDVMVKVVAQRGPLGVNVNSILWHDYVGGIIQRHCTNDTINHAAQIIGYDLMNPVPYWIVKNTWGPDFGEDGYLRIKIGDNLCGLYNQRVIRVILDLGS